MEKFQRILANQHPHFLVLICRWQVSNSIGEISIRERHNGGTRRLQSTCNELTMMALCLGYGKGILIGSEEKKMMKACGRRRIIKECSASSV